MPPIVTLCAASVCVAFDCTICALCALCTNTFCQHQQLLFLTIIFYIVSMTFTVDGCFVRKIAVSYFVL